MQIYRRRTLLPFGGSYSDGTRADSLLRLTFGLRAIPRCLSSCRLSGCVAWRSVLLPPDEPRNQVTKAAFALKRYRRLPSSDAAVATPLEAACSRVERRCGMKRLPKLLAQTVAAAAIALFWCISAVGTTVGTTVGVTTLATAINAATSTPAEARRRWRGRRWRGRRWRGGYGYPYYRGYGYPYYRRGWSVRVSAFGSNCPARARKQSR